MEWIKVILDKHIDEDGKIDVSKAMVEVSKEFPKQAITKEVFNQKIEDLKAANKLVEDLKKDNADVEALQTKISEYEKDIEDLNTTRLAEKKAFTLKEALKDAKAKDIDYMLYKLGEVEVDEDGNIKELDNKIKELKEAHTDMFEATEPQEPIVDDKGFKVLDNGLENGNEPNPATQVVTDFEQALGI